MPKSSTKIAMDGGQTTYALILVILKDLLDLADSLGGVKTDGLLNIISKCHDAHQVRKCVKCVCNF